MGECGLQQRVIFVCGADHSGSTLIGCALASEAGGHRDLFHVGECHAFFTDTHLQFGRFVPKSSIWSKIDRRTPADRVYGELFEKSGVRILIDSSKNLQWALVQARACQRDGTEFSIIVTIRPFDGLAHSLSRRGVRDGQVIRRISYYRDFFDFWDQVSSSATCGVDTKLFCDSPAAQLKALCERVDIPYFPEKELYWNYNHRHLFGAGMQQQHISAGAGSYETRPIPKGSLSSSLQRKLKSAALIDLEARVRDLIPKKAVFQK